MNQKPGNWVCCGFHGIKGPEFPLAGVDREVRGWLCFDRTGWRVTWTPSPNKRPDRMDRNLGRERGAYKNLIVIAADDWWADGASPVDSW